MGSCCSRFSSRREGEVEPLIIEATPPETRQWGCRRCTASYDIIHEITAHVGTHMPHTYETYNLLIVKNY